MRDLIVTENITLDGVIDATGNWFDVADEEAADIAEALREQSDAADAVVFGRNTFVDMRGYWPEHADVPGGVGEYLERVAKYAVSTRMDDPAWGNSTVLRGLDDVRALKDRPGKDIVTTGSITLVHALIAAGLVDEYRLFVYPVVLGRGARLFEDATGMPRLRVVENRTFASGVVLLRYRAD
ncbi:dihydrofolate reductase family protein [Actinomadura sp. WMMB 499]|uniref:dihydrofolate reductase family protein n=1 Tax=Actinomadura sp. WMMB 499 TaxID=1219491 RepID=UPI0012441B4C|nr:dihydrofolate reductase family protein [Actinomadura sp. WMMB 499]QFG23642.1 dihydrofolate reductase family protein [Actinomadura sp. WMMB 499]